MYDAPIVFFLIVTLFVEIRSHCQIKCMQYASMGAFKCPAFDACCRCAFTDERLVVFLLISIPEMGQCTSASGCVFVFFLPPFPQQRFAYLACIMFCLFLFFYVVYTFSAGEIAFDTRIIHCLLQFPSYVIKMPNNAIFLCANNWFYT